MKLRRPERNWMERERTKPRAIAAERRRHDPFCPSDDELISGAMPARLRTM